MRSEFSDITEEQFKLLTKKGIMPYDYINCFSKFVEECLPPIESFWRIDHAPADITSKLNQYGKISIDQLLFVEKGIRGGPS